MAFLPWSRGFLTEAGARGWMNADDEKILKVTKEVLVKFIEMGTVSPTNFDEKFRSVYWTIKDTVVSARLADLMVPPPSEEKTPEK
jgi:hypothetical protein